MYPYKKPWDFTMLRAEHPPPVAVLAALPVAAVLPSLRSRCDEVALRPAPWEVRRGGHRAP